MRSVLSPVSLFPEKWGLGRVAGSVRLEGQQDKPDQVLSHIASDTAGQLGTPQARAASSVQVWTLQEAFHRTDVHPPGEGGGLGTEVRSPPLSWPGESG